MKTKSYSPHRENQKYKYQGNNSGNKQIANMPDYRNQDPIQRKLLDHMNGNSKFNRIAAQMGNQYRVDTSDLKATHNSSFPATLNAEATIQGRNIHFAPGKDSTDNIKHEVAHAIDNTINGIPKGDRVVNGLQVDTSREKVADRIAGNQGIPFKMEKAGFKSLQRQSPIIQRKITVAKKERDEAEINHYLKLTKEDQKVFSEHIYPAYDGAGKSFKKFSKLKNRVKKILPHFVKLVDSSEDPVKDYITFQEEFQKRVRSNQSDYEFLLTTAGYEYEFAGLKNSPLNGVSHVEISRSNEIMPLTGLPFFLETDASNALELVTPPFLVPASKGRPMPDGEMAAKIDLNFRHALHLLTSDLKTNSVLSLVKGFKSLFGLIFKLDSVEVKAENLSANLDIEKVRGLVNNGKLVLDKDALAEIEIGENTKITNYAKGLKKTGKNATHLENGILPQINFAADMPTIALFNDLKSNLSGNHKAVAFSESEELYKEMIKMPEMSPMLEAVYQQMISKLASSGVLIYLRGLKKAQLELYKLILTSSSDTERISELKETIKENAAYISKVKNVRALWIKDHVASMASGLNSTDIQTLINALQKSQKKIKPHKLLSKDVETLIGSLMIIWKNRSKRKAPSDNRKPRLNHLYGHDETLIGARQGTYLDPAKVQLPGLWPGRRLHVAEVREGDIADTFKEVDS